ncbi:MAG TPA: hypothetical protein VHB99_20220, partial [Pirellulales bacterium]|nr:hypothetical protein [Pirellulales bacterium]
HRLRQRKPAKSARRFLGRMRQLYSRNAIKPTNSSIYVTLAGRMALVNRGGRKQKADAFLRNQDRTGLELLRIEDRAPRMLEGGKRFRNYRLLLAPSGGLFARGALRRPLGGGALGRGFLQRALGGRFGFLGGFGSAFGGGHVRHSLF